MFRYDFPRRRVYRRPPLGLAAARKTCEGIAREVLPANGERALNKFLTQYDWNEHQLNHERLEELQNHGEARWSQDGHIVIDDSDLIQHVESDGKDWIGPPRSNRQVTYGGEEIRVDALEERIDKVERDIDDETYRVWTQKRPVSKLGEVRLLIAEKVTDDEDEANLVKYLATNKIDAPSEHLIRTYSSRWRIETFFEDSKQDLGLGDCEVRDEVGASRHCHLQMLTDSLLRLGHGSSASERLTSKASSLRAQLEHGFK